MPDYSRQVNSTLIWKQCKNLEYSYIRPQTRCKAQLWVLGCDGDKYLARRDSRQNVNEWSQELVAETILSFSARGLIQKVNIILEESTIWCIFIETQGGERLKGCILTCTYDYCNTAQKVIRFYKNVAKISYNVSFNRWRLISQRKSYPRPFFCEFFHRSWMISFRHFHILKLHHFVLFSHEVMLSVFRTNALQWIYVPFPQSDCNGTILYYFHRLLASVPALESWLLRLFSFPS